MVDHVYILSLLVAFITTSALCVESVRRGLNLRTHRAFFAGSLALTVWVVGTLVEIVAPGPRGQWFGIILIYTGTVAVPPAWYILCRAIVAGDAETRPGWVRRHSLLGLFVPPVVLWVAVLTNPLHHGFIRGGVSPAWEYGPVRWIHDAYGFTVVALGLFALAQHWWIAPPPSERHPVWPLLAAVVGAVLGCAAWIVGLLPPAYNPTAPAFAIVSLTVGIYILRGGYFDVLPLSAFAVFEHLGDGVAILDAYDRVVSANHAARAFLGLTEEAAVGASFLQVAQVRFGWQAPPEAFFAGKRVRVEVQGATPARALALQRVRVGRRVTAAVHSAVHLRDITIEYEAERDLRRSEAAYRLLYADATDSIFTLDTAGHIIAANPATFHLGGYCEDDWADMSFMDVILPEFTDAVAETYERLLRGEVVTDFEYGMRRKDGTPLYLSFHGRPVLQDGAVVRIEGIARDVTERRRAAAQEKALGSQLAQAQKLGALGRMLAGVAHELNNPLTGILGYADMLAQDATLPAASQRHLERILNSAEQCQAIVADLLRFAQNRPVNSRPVHLSESVAQVCAMTRDDLETHGIELVTEIPDEVWIQTDVGQFHQCLLNLVRNARDALATQPGARIIRLVAVVAGDRVRLSVEDTGPGIAPEDAPRIFDPFFTTKSLGQGTGLGLSVCHSLLAQVDATIELDQHYAQGARFLLSLPRCTAPAATPPASPLPAATGATGRIVLADDNEDVRDFCVSSLEAAGYHVRAAEDGRDVLALLAQESADLIVSDIRMPRMDGASLHAVLQAREGAPPIVFITGDAVREETREFLSQTGAPYLLKPFRSAQLLELVRTALGARAPASVPR